MSETTINADRSGTADAPAMRLLVPIDATARSHWGVQYAVWQHRNGRSVEVSLLHVIEPLARRFDILRFYTEREVAALRSRNAEHLLDAAAEPLRNNRIVYRGYLREGNVVFEILDAAEQFACDQIVIPAPRPGWLRLLTRNIAARVVRQERTVAVITVNAHGLPGPD